MKEADKNLLNEIAHLSRLIKKKEKVKNVTKTFSNFPPTHFNHASNVNKFKFFKPTVNGTNVFPKSKYSTLPTNKFKFCKTVPDSIYSNSAAATNNVGSAVSRVLTTSFNSPAKVESPLSFEVSQSCQVDAGKEKLGTNSHLTPSVFLNPNHFTPVTSSLRLDTQVARTTLYSNPYTFRKSDGANSSIPEGGKIISLKDITRLDLRKGAINSKSDILLMQVSKPPDSSHDRTPPTRTGLSPKNSLFHSILQKSVGNLAVASGSGSKDCNVPVTKSDSTNKHLARCKVNFNNIQSKATHNQYKLDRRTKAMKQSYSLLAKNGPRRFKRCDAKSTDKKYVITRHSLRKLKDSPKRFLAKSHRIPKASKIVKIQGATYESRNKGKTLKRIRTSSTSYSQLCKMEFKYIQTPVKKFASQVLKKCKTALIKNRQKRNVFCKFYNMFGVCKGVEDGTCRFVHDKRQIVVCSKFIVGKCDNENCTLSHDLENGRLPLCRFFKIGRCTRNDCPYSHVMSRKKIQLRKLKINATPVTDVKPDMDKKAVVSVARKTIHDTEKMESKSNSRYYQRIPNSNPVQALIPRRLPLSLAENFSDSDSESDTNYNSNASDSDESEIHNISDNVSTVKKQDTVDYVTKSDSTREMESNKSIFQSVAIMTSTTTNVRDSVLGSNEPVTDSTSEKRQRLLGLQNNLKRRAAAIRNENLNSD